MSSLFERIDVAVASAPPPPKRIPDNVCCSECDVCCRQWFEDTITMFRCQCGDLRVCPTCADDMKELESMEHNLIDCNYLSDEEDE